MELKHNLKRKSIPKPLITEKPTRDYISKRKLSFIRNKNILLNKYSNSQKSNSKTDMINIKNYNETSPRIIKNEFPKRKLNRAKTFLDKIINNEKREGIYKKKRKKVKNLELLIKLVDENEKIEKEFYSNDENIKNGQNTIKFERNKSDERLFIPSVTYNKKDIYYNKKYDLIQKNYEHINNHSYKNISTNSNVQKNINIKGNHNFPKNEHLKYNSSLIKKIEKNKINLPIRKKKKSFPRNLNDKSPYNMVNINSINKQIMLSNKLIDNYLLKVNNTFSYNFFNTEINNENENYMNKNSSSVKTFYYFVNAKSKEKIRKNKILPLLNKIIEESSKIEKDLKNKYKNLNDS